MARRRRNHNFKIHVDPSCLSEPMDDEPAEAKVGDGSEELADSVQLTNEVTPDDQTTAEAEEEGQEGPQDVDIEHQEPGEQEQSIQADPEASLLSHNDGPLDQSEHQSELTEDSNTDVSELADLQNSVQDGSRIESSEVPELDVSQADVEAETSVDVSSSEQLLPKTVDSEESEPAEVEMAHEDASMAPEESVSHQVDDDISHISEDASMLQSEVSGGSSDPSASSTVRPSIEHDDDGEPQAQDEPSQSRRTSQRTEELIAAAARGIIAHIDQHTQSRHSAEQDIEEDSILSTRTDQDVNEESFADDSELDHNNTHSHISRGSLPKDDGGESSSQHEGTDEEVFSDKSPRSSVGSYDAGSESGKRKSYTDDRSTVTRSPRVSDISQYDREEFIPTTRSTPRPRFRTTSDVRAMQMSSPSGSVYGGSPRSPRSPKRTHPTGSRLGTPTSSTQYSPKKGSTPPRFKAIKEAPLVLLHVTLVPLHWAWGDLVNSLESSDLSDEMKGLRDAWRVLQDRIGDTVVERGILLGHPQNDYELLEERLLEALELPQRRRARILECGHYLGPSNETTVSESEESEDEFGYQRRTSGNNKRHWCSTCRNEIRLEELGSSRVFRVKVYASNGLMRAGAWAACWKEMERVDVEIEPIVESSVQDELVRLAAMQEEREFTAREEQEIAREVAQRYEEEKAAEEQAAFAARAIEYHPMEQQVIAAVPTLEQEQSRMSLPPAMPTQSHEPEPVNFYPTPSPPSEESAKPRATAQEDEYAPPPSPRSPSEEAQERRDNRRKQFQGASLPELLLAALKVLLQDRKNLVIIALSVVALLFALRTAPSTPLHEPLMREVMDTVPQLHVTTAVHTQQIISQVPTAAVEAEPVIESALKADTAIAVESSEAPQSVQLQEANEVVANVAVPARAEPVTIDVNLELHRAASQPPPQVKKSSPLELDAEPFTPKPDTGLELVQSRSRKPVVLKETIKVYRTVTETQVEFETLVETIRVYATETYQPQQAEATAKRLEIGA
ncbi:uncharacterized protein B0I36DRAFT_310275 [Microdochium trichocladiopsis]|uniref:Pathway-specific nitrogen regulator n=1 Tax=Microdochium trichocladiopsis TaxID=1682393 RepID=A0A9P8YGT4_9PEZI|nr:uncharacterized protein B0I36DRAFT_310275 [Microdochium trichocladiopsis]KAH7040251.1 hypothetical protein B0I36DRAFT_310275 [Microdochium trichocladiopsis]